MRKLEVPCWRCLAGGTVEVTRRAPSDKADQGASSSLAALEVGCCCPSLRVLQIKLV